MTEPTEHGIDCEVCHRGFTTHEWDRRHTPHVEGCPGQQDAFEALICFCDRNIHERCAIGSGAQAAAIADGR